MDNSIKQLYILTPPNLDINGLDFLYIELFKEILNLNIFNFQTTYNNMWSNIFTELKNVYQNKTPNEIKNENLINILISNNLDSLLINNYIFRDIFKEGPIHYS